MNALPAFPSFFRALWEKDPFPWQTMLARRGAEGDWPQAIELPTASGKTACLDAALFALAGQADLSLEQRIAPRRIWYVVDRRIVVDEAFDRARQLADKLLAARVSQDRGVLGSVAEKLCTLSGTQRPLAVARLRGGAWRDDGWARVPSQPAIICSTVDQVGSALLFRAYGHGMLTASVWAGLAANDSLILLDEAHCSVPFLQTLRAIQRFHGATADRRLWAEEPLTTPFRFTVFSATLPAQLDDELELEKVNRFPRNDLEREQALNHPKLTERFKAGKPAALVVVKKAKGPGDPFVAEATRHTAEFTRRSFAQNRKPRVAVMVNRVATAGTIADAVRVELAGSAEVVLLTGRIRPLERDLLVQRWSPVLKATPEREPDKPVVFVTTQCLEVGADFSFDALVTECASLDALRQRFGRLNRLGYFPDSPAVILIREQDTKQPKDEGDPVYGPAIYHTWQWLTEHARPDSEDRVDFGITALDALVRPLRAADPQRFARLLAPATDAPVLLPAHLDLLCQTSHQPVPEPDVSLFLHGKGLREREVRVVVRADLPALADDQPQDETFERWIEILAVTPPVSPEMLTLPLPRLRRWLARTATETDTGSDVQGQRMPSEKDDEPTSRRVPFVVWRGRESFYSRELRHIKPNDVVVLRADERDLARLRQLLAHPDGLGFAQLDLWERSFTTARARPVLRLHEALWAPWSKHQAVGALLNVAKDPELDTNERREALYEALLAVREAAQTSRSDGLSLVESDAGALSLPLWISELVTELASSTNSFRWERHPDGGLVLFAKHRMPGQKFSWTMSGAEAEDNPFADADDLPSASDDAVSLADHNFALAAAARAFAARCLSAPLAKTVAAAAPLHDLGKLDPRFQILLNHGDALAASAGEPLAKSERLPVGRRSRLNIAREHRLPEGFRHEFLSLQLAERSQALGNATETTDLILHLVASHHGYGRPFAPVVIDYSPEDIDLNRIGIPVTLSSEDRKKFPAYCLESGVADRFWRLTRRYGWWGLAYLEAIFRLSDWHASEHPEPNTGSGQNLAVAHNPPEVNPTVSTAVVVNRLDLSALDGANPLGFLAALGTLRLLARLNHEADFRLGWQRSGGAWRPFLLANPGCRIEALMTELPRQGLQLELMFSDSLLEAARMNGQPDKLAFPVPVYRLFARTAAPASAEYAAAWAGEPSSEDNEEGATAQRTRFDFTAGQQAFIKMLRELRVGITADAIRHALLDGWRYSSTATSMRWDPLDEKRQYALQAVDPTNGSKNPPLADAGANFLAVEALPLFPLVPDRFVSQPCFLHAHNFRSFRWPLWTTPVSLDVIRSLLTLPLEDAELWRIARRPSFGIEAIFRSAIVQPSGRYRCFTPAASS